MDKLIVILGPTASGKTALANQLAYKNNGAIISADSRQVYRKMDIGTGKDLDEYEINKQKIPYYLIDICEPGEKYNLSLFQKDAEIAIDKINNNNKLPIICGGTGLYIEAFLNNYNRTQITSNLDLRNELNKLSKDELSLKLKTLNTSNESFDYSTKKRIIRAIEIVLSNKTLKPTQKRNDYIIFGINIDRETRRQRISERLDYRLKYGLIEEVENLLTDGVSHETLQYYGLEYKYLSYYLSNLLSFEEMKIKLNTEIHRFAKRQMTWFRRMEKNGFQINWIPFDLSINEKISFIEKIIS